MQTVLGLLLLLSLLGQSQGRGGGGGPPFRGPGGPPFGGPGKHNNSNKSAWNRTVDTTNIRQVGFVNETERKVVVITFADPRQQNITPSVVFYNYTGDKITVVKSGPTCFITPSSPLSNYDSASTDVAARNGTNVTAPLTEVRLNATQRLDEEARKDFTAENPGVDRLCAHGPIYNTTAADDATFPETETPETGPRVIDAFGLTERYRIVSSDAAPNGFGPGRHPGGKPGKRPHGPSRGKLDKGRGGPPSEAQTTTPGN